MERTEEYEAPTYEAPNIVVLGTIAELTFGHGGGPESDTFSVSFYS